MEYLLYVLIGGAAGVLSGMFGIGGGILVVPSLVYLLGFNQQRAQGTSLAVFLVPVGLLAAINYYKKDQVEVVAAAVIAVCLFAGGYFGSKIALSMPEALLRKLFAGLLVVAALQMFFKR